MKSRLCVSALIRNGDKILLGKKSKNKGPYPDTWHMPGGGLNSENEKSDDAVRREIFEETGLKIKNLQRLFWDDDIEHDKNGVETYYIFLQYTCDFNSGKLHPKDDLELLEWVDINDLSNYKLNAPTRKLISRLKNIQK